MQSIMSTTSTMLWNISAIDWKNQRQIVLLDYLLVQKQYYEKNYNKLIDYLQQYPLIQYYMPYLEEMLKQNRKKTLLNIINNFKYLPYGENHSIIDAEKENYLTVYQILSKFFHEDELTAFLHHHLPYFQKTTEGSLVNFISKNLI